MKFIEFASKEEMIAYEKDREEYYMQFLNTKNTLEFYKLWLKELFAKEYRELKKKYDGYLGGWYRDEKGIIRAHNISYILDSDRIKDGDIFIDNMNTVFVFHNTRWMRIL